MFIGIVFTVVSYIEMKYIGIIIGLEIISLGIIMFVIWYGYNYDDIFGGFIGFIMIITGIIEIGISIAILIYSFGA